MRAWSHLGRVGVMLFGGILALGLTGATPPPGRPTPGAPLATGGLTGFVRDESGRPIAQATVTAQGASTSNTATDGTGRYTFRALPVGRYRVTVRAINFKAWTQDSVQVRPDSVTTLDVTLASNPLQLGELVVAGRAPMAAEAFLGSAVAGVAATPAPPARARLEQKSQRRPDWNTENYATIEEARFASVAASPRSTFSIDADAASYTNVRRFLTQGTRPPKDAVRIEELLNYFRYAYPEPKGDTPFRVTTDVAVCPWQPAHRLLRIGIKGRSLKAEALPPSNLVFLLDVSGSMNEPAKLPLVKQAFRLLVHELRPADRVAIVVYAGAAGLVLPSTPASEKATILTALDRLEAGGSTAGGAGLRLAYDVAQENFLAEGNNRVILATDGDFNIGESSDAAMVRLVEERRDRGVFLTVLGFGTGNLKDAKMEQMADKGNGNYAYVDNLREAQRVFVREFSGTLVTIAKDVKIQVEFNPARVQAYRLLGYENRLLATEDFADDKKDAGELGAGHTVTALYELVPAGASLDGTGINVDSLKYQRVQLRPEASQTDEWLTVKLRYKEPRGATSRLLAQPVAVNGEVRPPSGEFGFAAAVAEFGLLLRDSRYKGTATYDDVLAMARAGRGEDPEGERSEFARMVELARGLELAAGDARRSSPEERR